MFPRAHVSYYISAKVSSLTYQHSVSGIEQELYWYLALLSAKSTVSKYFHSYIAEFPQLKAAQLKQSEDGIAPLMVATVGLILLIDGHYAAPWKLMLSHKEALAAANTLQMPPDYLFHCLRQQLYWLFPVNATKLHFFHYKPHVS